MRRRLLYVLMAVCFCGLLVVGRTAAADPPDITGKWYGTWRLAGECGWSQNFSITFLDSPYGLLASMYAPEFGSFGDYLPVIIEESSDGYFVTIGVAGYSEISGFLDGDTVAGSFYVVFDGDPPVVVSGDWYAEKQSDQERFPGEAPGQQCDELPPLFCVGDLYYCSELVPFEPRTGEGYVKQCNAGSVEQDQSYSYIRRDLMMLIKYATAKVACKTEDWDYGNYEPLALLDMSEEDGSTPTNPSGTLRHPPVSHRYGNDIDTAYYQIYAADNLARPVGVHHDGYYEAYHLTGPPYALDAWRTALYNTYLSEHPLLRVIGVDGQIGPVLDDALNALVDSGWIDPDLRASIPMVYEVDNMGYGFYYHHHHHTHISMNTVYDMVADSALEPETLERESNGRFVTAHIEFVEAVDVSQVNTIGIALILSGDVMLYAQPENVRITDYNQNGIADLTVKFDRQEVLEAIENGDVEIAIIGLVDTMFFQASDTVRVMGKAKPTSHGEQRGHRGVPFTRPGGRHI